MIGELKRELTVAQSQRSMQLRRGESTAAVDATIQAINARIKESGATVAEVNTAGRFTTDAEVTPGELSVRDGDLSSTIGSQNWSMQYPWR